MAEDDPSAGGNKIDASTISDDGDGDDEGDGEERGAAKQCLSEPTAPLDVREDEPFEGDKRSRPM